MQRHFAPQFKKLRGIAFVPFDVRGIGAATVVVFRSDTMMDRPDFPRFPSDAFGSEDARDRTFLSERRVAEWMGRFDWCSRRLHRCGTIAVFIGPFAVTCGCKAAGSGRSQACSLLKDGST
jgi:hypothetical protein